MNSLKWWHYVVIAVVGIPLIAFVDPHWWVVFWKMFVVFCVLAAVLHITAAYLGSQNVRMVVKPKLTGRNLLKERAFIVRWIISTVVIFLGVLQLTNYWLPFGQLAPEAQGILYVLCGVVSWLAAFTVNILYEARSLPPIKPEGS